MTEKTEDKATKKITLNRKIHTELKVSSAPGQTKTVAVEVRKKRTYVKRDASPVDSDLDNNLVEDVNVEAEASAETSEVVKDTKKVEPKIIEEKVVAEARKAKAPAKKDNGPDKAQQERLRVAKERAEAEERAAQEVIERRKQQEERKQHEEIQKIADAARMASESTVSKVQIS